MERHKYNPDKHHRRSIRLPKHDYTTPGAYYVTVGANKRQFIFGDIIDGIMHPNFVGKTVKAVWYRLPQHFKNVTLDAFVIMPNHLHGIIILNDNNWQRSPQKKSPTLNGTKPGSLSAIVQNFKSLSSRQVNGILKSSGTIWQSNFYEHIPRNEGSLNRIRQYILDNPKNWENDKENPTYRRCRGNSIRGTNY
ncbi:MAG: glucose-6-phosphate 1-dehydrogenase [Okeania sp. SIO2H7]|nr:glucose-6-phosphate 1-dehydrogenase [Okeania sp. SIO2H7]